MKTRKLFITTLLLSSLFMTAVTCEDECDRCQSAIDHMLGKIEDQNCNPNRMEKAWNAIQDECDFFDSAVGLMAETCNYGTPSDPGCHLPSANMGYNRISIFIKVENQTNSGYYLHATMENNTISYEIGEGETTKEIYFSPNITVSEGDSFEILIEKIDEDEETTEVASDSKRFTFVRNGRWHLRREVAIMLKGENTSIGYGYW